MGWEDIKKKLEEYFGPYWYIVVPSMGLMLIIIIVLAAKR